MSTNHREFYLGLERASAASAGARGAARASAVHATVATAPSQEAACQNGCDHCCHFPVGIRLEEAVLLAASIEADDALQRRLLDEDAQTSTHTWEALAGRPCPLLVGGQCARYDQRPTPCRALLSADAQACEQSLKAPTPVPRDETSWWRGLGAAALLDGELGARELRSALAAVVKLAPGAGDRAIASAFAAARGVAAPKA